MLVETSTEAEIPSAALHSSVEHSSENASGDDVDINHGRIQAEEPHEVGEGEGLGWESVKYG